MPRVVASYVEKHDLSECMGLLDDLLVTLRDDFAKYKKRAPVSRLAEVHNAVFLRAGQKFMYSKIDSSASPPSLKAALEMLVKAGLAIKVHHTSARGTPLGAQAKPSKFKVLPSDVGLCQRAVGLDLSGLLVANVAELVNRGPVAEVLVGHELIRCASPRVRPEVYYWHREARGSQAEVDYVIQAGTEVLPIEVKAGTSGRMRSMHMFLTERGLKRGIRASLENFSRYGSIETVPLYALWCLRQ
jgi:predicted AAA+ superfamily ATPase